MGFGGAGAGRVNGSVRAVLVVNFGKEIEMCNAGLGDYKTEA